MRRDSLSGCPAKRSKRRHAITLFAPHPDPRILLPLRNQPRPHRVLENVSNLSVQGFRRAQHMIERLALPYAPESIQPLINELTGSSLDSAHDLSQRIELAFLVVDQRREDDMHMIGHHQSDMQKVHEVVVV